MQLGSSCFSPLSKLGFLKKIRGILKAYIFWNSVSQNLPARPDIESNHCQHPYKYTCFQRHLKRPDLTDCPWDHIVRKQTNQLPTLYYRCYQDEVGCGVKNFRVSRGCSYVQFLLITNVLVVGFHFITWTPRQMLRKLRWITRRSACVLGDFREGLILIHRCECNWTKKWTHFSNFINCTKCSGKC